MDMIQILLLLLVPILTYGAHPCYDEHELKDKAIRKLNSHYPQPLEPTGISPSSEVGSPVCPVDLDPQSLHYKDRSLSPWRYIHNTKEDRFPATIAVAECLCDGCITTKGEENMDYNSVLITQSRVVLKKELCEDGKKYRLRPVSEEVGVGCTCVKANSHTFS